MGTKTVLASPAADSNNTSKLLDQYGCGPVTFEGTGNALYENHLLFDSVIDLTVATPRDQFESMARSVRDVLSKGWVLKDKIYELQM